MGQIRIDLMVAAVCLGAGLAAPALAQQDNEQAIDALIDESSPANAVPTARAQTAAGDLMGAAATLERALLADPNANDARLLYAATLCRLGDAQGARIEIGKLNRQDFADAAWAETQSACGGDVARPAPPPEAAGSRLTGEAYAGIAYDSDARGAIALQIEGGFTPVVRDDGLSAIAGLRLAMRSAGYGGRGGLYGSLNVSAKHDISGPSLNYQVGELRAGLGRDHGNMGFGIGGVVRQIRLSGNPYVMEIGGQGELLFGNPDATRFRLRAEAVDQNYQRGYPGDPADGMRYDLSAAVETRLAGRGWASLGVGGEVKDADRRDLGYRGARLFGVVQMPVGGHGQYANLSGTLRRINFQDNPPFPDRKDTRAFARAAYGVPLFRPIVLEGGVSYTSRISKLRSTTPYSLFGDIADYHSVGGDMRLLWKF